MLVIFFPRDIAQDIKITNGNNTIRIKLSKKIINKVNKTKPVTSNEALDIEEDSEDEPIQPAVLDKLIENTKDNYINLKKDLKKSLKSSETTPNMEDFNELIKKLQNNELSNKQIDDKLKELKLDNNIEYLKQIILIHLDNI